MDHIQFFLLVGSVFLIFHKASGASVNSTSDDSLDDRFNLNFNYGQASGIGKYGGVSQSNAASYGANVGIRGPGGQYQNLYSQTGSQGNSFSSGPGAPLTFANANSRVQPGYAGGNAGAGVYGGKGSAHAGSINQNIEIPLDIYGTVLLSNLKERNSTKSKNDTTETTAPVSKKEPAPLVFS
ncbi:hypothetical protein Ocin01_08555 [Orchesella cincta]|uniref:Uncharacterized protein n=1 Tax=Orchesella cincta TaxID=48709 RepID=A0A1D2MYQ5_ORCCI|nr:hypothetical protein Ocin01_08555 [Orchesella cincta]